MPPFIPQLALFCTMRNLLPSLVPGAVSEMGLGRRPMQSPETMSGQFLQENPLSQEPGRRSRKMRNVPNKWSPATYHWPLDSSLAVRGTADSWTMWARQEAPMPGTKCDSKYGPAGCLLSQTSTAFIIIKPSKVQRVKTWAETNLLYESTSDHTKCPSSLLMQICDWGGTVISVGWHGEERKWFRKLLIIKFFKYLLSLFVLDPGVT